MASNIRSLQRLMRLASCGLLVALTSGCISRPRDISPLVRVTPAPPPAVSTSLPYLPEIDERLAWTIPDSNQFTEPHLITFAAAREAYWNRDLATAEKLLRELRAADGISEPHFWWVLIQCYEEGRRWADSLPLYTELGIQEKRRAWMEQAQFMMTLPSLELNYAAENESVAMNREWGDLVIVQGLVDGTPARLLLDTGATSSWLAPKFAQRAGVEMLERGGSLTDSNKVSRPAGAAMIRELKLGGLTVRNAEAAVAPSSLLERIFGVDGIVGWSVLRETDITWNFVEGTVTFERASGVPIAEPNLSGQILPILSVRSPEGRRLDLFFDTGFTNSDGSIGLYRNEGLIETKTSLAHFRRPWLPTLTWGVNSMAVSWPRRVRPFEFWMAGHRFELPAAYVYNKAKSAEQLVYYDGIIGTAPFLGGILKTSAQRREVRFEVPPKPEPAVASMVR